MRSAVALACVTCWVAVSSPLLVASRASAVPPAGAALGSAALEEGRWLQHTVIPGERLAEIAERYGVSTDRIARWNELDAKRPIIRAGQELRIYTTRDATDRVRETYRVRRGDSWSSIAKRFGVGLQTLRDQWNRRHGDLRPGDRVVVFREREPEPEPEPELAEAEVAEPDPGDESLLTSVAVRGASPLPSVTVPSGALSVGSPNRGRLLHGTQVPENPELYTLRDASQSYGSSHAIAQLQAAIAAFREQSRFDGELVIMDMSRASGGRFRPHRSHQSGRDVDIKLPTRKGGGVDWNATWALVRALERTGQVRFIFLSRIRQRALHAAAKRAGTSDAELERLLQFPRRSRTSLVRHARGHVEHLHVRFACGPHETRCHE